MRQKQEERALRGRGGRDKMRIAICDDERNVREIMAERVKSFCPEAEVFLYASGQELLASEKKADILFLDIQMPGLDGMETAGRLRERNKGLIIIFVTALEEYVFQAFDVGAFHYLVKPFSEDKFASVLRSAAAQYEACREEKEERHLMIQSGGSHIKIRLRDIIYAEVFNRKVVIHKAAEDIEYYGKLSDLERLAGEDFFRPHRAFLVNFQYVVKYNAAEITLEKGTVPISKKNYAVFVKSYLKYNQRTGSGGRI